MMKKLFALILAMLMVFAMAGCDKVEQAVDNAANKVADKIAEKVDSAVDNTNETALNNEGTNEELNGYATERPLPTAVETPATTPATAPSTVVGTYYLTDMMEGGVSVPAEELRAISFTLDNGGVGTYGIPGDSVDITWSQSGNTITLVADAMGGEENPFILTISGNSLVGDTDGAQMVFTKG